MSVPVAIIANPNAPHQVRHAQAMAAGLRRHGVQCHITHGATSAGQTVVCWGWRKGGPLHAAGHSVLVMERGYVGDRFTWTSLAWNGLNNKGTVPPVPEDDGRRFRRHFDGLLQPWNPTGDYVLIAGQVHGDASLNGLDLNGWYRAQVARPWDLPVRFRPHPLSARRGAPPSLPGVPFMTGDLGPALNDAAAVITYNSNCGVDALLAGKPTEVQDSGSMAWGVGEDGRERWAHRLAWRQWLMAEIEDGTALDHVGWTNGG